MSFKAVNNFGMDKEIADRMNAKYDKNLENDIQSWIEQTTGITFDKPFAEMLQNGVVLCELVNKLMPGKIKKINKAGGLFRFQENITNFLRVCREIGVNEASLFPTESLAQLKDMNQVLTCINAFKNQMDGKGRSASKGSTGGKWQKPATETRAQSKGPKKSKWVVKSGGSAGVSLMNQGSAAVMQRNQYTDAREQIKRKELDGEGAKGTVSAWSQGASKMERLKYTDAREEIKQNRLDGKGSKGEVSAWNQGASRMERNKYTDAREQIKRNELDGSGAQGEVSTLNQGSIGMERSKYVDPREQIKRGEL